MQIVQIDMIDAEPFERGVAGLPDVLRTPIDHAPGRFAASICTDAGGEAKLRRQRDAIAASA